MPETKVLHTITTRKRMPAWHIFIGRCTNEAEDKLELVQITAAGKDWLALKHFAEDTPVIISPNIYEDRDIIYPTPHMSIAVV